MKALDAVDVPPGKEPLGDKMSEPWKTLICDSRECMNEMEISEPPEKYETCPEIDTEELTQFRCPRCGKVEVWGPLRRTVAQSRYKKQRFSKER